MRVVVLFSGGIDSYAGYLEAKRLYGLEHTVTPMYIDYKGTGCNKEREIATHLVPETVVVENVFNFKNKEVGADSFLYARNLYFVTYASQFADLIYLCGLKNSEMLDNCRDFYSVASAAVTQVKGSLVQVVSPFVNMEKEEVVESLFNRHGVDVGVHALTLTTSCYDSVEQFCWNCPNCFYYACAAWKYKKHLPFQIKFKNEGVVEHYYEKAKNHLLPPKRTKSIMDIYKHIQKEGYDY